MLDPVLKEQNSRPEFDFHSYGMNMLADMDAAAQTGKKVTSFREIAQGQPRWEVCRRFLTTLVLTNHGNIDIVAGSEEERMNRFGLKLLNAKKELPSLHDDPDAAKAKN